MRKILLVVITLIITATVANAASINGEFKGNAIVKVKSNGKELTVDNTPAIVYNGNTMIPIVMLKQPGVNVSWDQKTSSVNVTVPNVGIDVGLLARQTKASGVSAVGYFNDGVDFDKLTYYYTSTLDDLFKNSKSWTNILINGASTDVYLIEIMDTQDSFFTVPNKAVKDFLDGKLSNQELTEQYKVNEI